MSRSHIVEGLSAVCGVVGLLTSLVVASQRNETVSLDEAQEFFTRYFSEVTKGEAARKVLWDRALTEGDRRQRTRGFQGFNDYWSRFSSVTVNVQASSNQRVAEFYVREDQVKSDGARQTIRASYTLTCDSLWSRLSTRSCDSSDLRIQDSQKIVSVE